MSDLISRNRAISILEQLEEHSLSGKMDISNAIYLLNNQPTAYDVDKVVEQLEDYGNEETRYYKNTPYEKCIEECINKAIEIVKGGGVDG